MRGVFDLPREARERSSWWGRAQAEGPVGWQGSKPVYSMPTDEEESEIWAIGLTMEAEAEAAWEDQQIQCMLEDAETLRQLAEHRRLHPIAWSGGSRCPTCQTYIIGSCWMCREQVQEDSRLAREVPAKYP